jgi:DNA-binding protein YbaB
MQRIIQAAQQVQAQYEALADSTVTGTAGGGAVRAVVSGAGQLLDLTIEPSVIDPGDPAETAATIADLVLAAVRDATRAVGEMQQRQFGALAGGVGGFDLSSMGGPGGFDLSSLGLGGVGAVPGSLAEDEYEDDDEDYEDDEDDEDDARKDKEG